MITYFYVIRKIHMYIFLLPYTYTRLHIYTPIYLYIFTYFYAQICPIHVNIQLRTNSYMYYNT